MPVILCTGPPMDILLITDAPQKWGDCIPILEQAGGRVRIVPDMSDALDHIRTSPPVLTILDLGIDTKAMRQAIIEILMINASVHTAVTSEMPEEHMHDAMEGLGTLMFLPSSPGRNDMLALLDALNKVS